MRQADEADFVEFVAARSGSLLRFAVMLTGNRADAEDLLQTAFLRLAGRWSHDLADPNAYAKKILVNLAVRGWRARQRRTRLDYLTPVVVSPDHAESVVYADAVFRALSALPKRQRAAVVLRYVEGMPEREVAEVMGCSVGTVKSHASRGLAQLRIELSETSTTPSREATP